MLQSREEKYLFSIVIPAYNVENSIVDCVNSAINQTYNNLEIILVDDGSVDNTGVLCDMFIHRDDRIKVIHQNNGGLSAARNSGMRIAKGDFLFLVDSDDSLSVDAIEILYNRIIELDKQDLAPELFVFGFNKIRCGACKEEIYRIEKLEKNGRKGLYTVEDFIKRIKDVQFGDLVGYEPVWDKLYRMEFIREWNLFFNEEIKYNEDREYNCRYLKHCKYIEILNGCLYNYYILDPHQTGKYTLSALNTSKSFEIINQSYEKFLLPLIEYHNLSNINEVMDGFYHDYYNELVKCLLKLYRRDSGYTELELRERLEYILNYPLVKKTLNNEKNVKNNMEDEKILRMMKTEDKDGLAKYLKIKSLSVYG